MKLTSAYQVKLIPLLQITSLGLMSLSSRVDTLVCVFMYPTRQPELPDQTPRGKTSGKVALKHRDVLGTVDVYAGIVPHGMLGRVRFAPVQTTQHRRVTCQLVEVPCL